MASWDATVTMAPPPPSIMIGTTAFTHRNVHLDVDRENPIPGRLVRLRDRAAEGNRSRGHQHVDAAGRGEILPAGDDARTLGDSVFDGVAQ